MKAMELLEQDRPLQRDDLDGRDYLASLLNAAQRRGLLYAAEVERIQTDCMLLIVPLAERESKGESSSLRIEHAQSLLNSICYTIGVRLKGLGEPMDALKALRQTPAATLYAEGRAEITVLLRRARQIHQQLVKTLFYTPNIFYRSTLAEGITGFFRLYDPDFAAQTTHITADYPLLLHTGPGELSGIEFILLYLTRATLENRFLLHFTPAAVHQLLCGLYSDERPFLINLCEPVLAAALGCVLVGLPPRTLHLTPDALTALQKRFRGQPTEKITKTLTIALTDLALLLALPALQQAYLQRTLPHLAWKIQYAMELDHLEQVFPLPLISEARPVIHMSYGERMPDKQYTKLLEALLLTPAADKAALVAAEIRSLADLTDLLHDAALDTADYLPILNALSPALVAGLCKEYPQRALLVAPSDLALFDALQQYRTALPPQRRTEFDQALEILQLGESEIP